MRGKYVALIIVGIISLSLSPAIIYSTTKDKKENKKYFKTETYYKNNHEFMYISNGWKSNLIHSPDCQCLKKVSNEKKIKEPN